MNSQIQAGRCQAYKSLHNLDTYNTFHKGEGDKKLLKRVVCDHCQQVGARPLYGKPNAENRVSLSFSKR